MAENALEYPDPADIAKAGHYNKQGLNIIKRVRCGINPGDAECVTKTEID